MKSDVFISHASEDKNDIARPLAEELKGRGFKVWYDEYVLRLGDSLRRAIDKGLASCQFGVVILSPNFFDKEWPQRELDGLAALEVDKGEKFILPVWHNVGRTEILQYSPTLADKLGVPTSKGVQFVADRIEEVLRDESLSPE